jgi:glycosyltransferase involved in cell wall biosynthesis
MIMGSFPIQSNTSCADEWLRHGESGFIVPAEDSTPIAESIRRAVTDDALVDKASEINLKVARARLDTSVVKPQVVEMYKQIFAQRAGKTKKARNAGETIKSLFPGMDQE